MFIIPLLTLVICQNINNSVFSPSTPASWKWQEGTRFAGGELVFTKENKIELIKKPLKEYYILTEGYSSHWNKVEYRNSTYAASIGNQSKPHIPYYPNSDTFYTDFSVAEFTFNNLKIENVGSRLEMTGTCSYHIEYGRKGESKTIKLKEEDISVKFVADSSSLSKKAILYPLPKVSEKDSLQFDKEVLGAIVDLLEKNHDKSPKQLQRICEKKREANPNSPMWVAVEHYFFGLTFSPNSGGKPSLALEGTSYILAWGWEIYSETIGHGLSLFGDKSPGPRGDSRGDFQPNIAYWGSFGLMGWKPNYKK